jgi:hypothetical protein
MHTTSTRRSDPTARPSRRAKALLALGAASLALIAAVPAGATDDKPPVDKNGKQSCKVMTNLAEGTYYWAPHGTQLTRVNPTSGRKQTETCDDGSWVISRTRSGGTVGGTSGTLSGAHAKVLRLSPSELRHLAVTPG